MPSVGTCDSDDTALTTYTTVDVRHLQNSTQHFKYYLFLPKTALEMSTLDKYLVSLV